MHVTCDRKYKKIYYLFMNNYFFLEENLQMCPSEEASILTENYFLR